MIKSSYFKAILLHRNGSPCFGISFVKVLYSMITSGLSMQNYLFVYVGVTVLTKPS